MSPSVRRFLSLGAVLLAMAIPSARAEAATIDQLAAALGILTPKELVKAPEVVGPGLDGNTIRLGDFRGKVVFLNFWATWCIPCREEMPAMERLHQEFKGQGLVVLAVNYQENPSTVRAFIRELKLTFPVVLDPNGDAATKYLVRGLPATFLIDRNQVIAGRAIGAREWDSKDGRAYIRALLAKTR
ncbi:MAG: TlpA family protein disulfide reductase [candidate division NC10 bacterium]|nr:TlpA family protein disulfide reductase [candidate division NC10 bacterium]